MTDEHLDYSIERQRHKDFVGRAGLLARLDELLITDCLDRWVVVTGGPGMGKSALLARWLTRREAAGTAVPHHFIRRGEYDWDNPAKLVGSLVAQIKKRFPGCRDVDPDPRMHPAARLATVLGCVSEHDLVPRGERLIVLIDGLDEYDPPDGARIGDPLAAFLPHALPRGVSFLCATRPKHPYVDMLAARHGEHSRIDLDEQAFAEDNEATVRAFWERAARTLGLDASFVDEAVARAVGNLQHAATLRQQLAGSAAVHPAVGEIPRGLAALLAKSWERIATEPLAVHGLGILCAAREALTLDELAAVAGWPNAAQRQAFVRAARELLVETRRVGGASEYRLHHDAIRAHIAMALGTDALRGHHRELARRFATWPAPADATTRRYALRYALIHRTETADWEDAWRISTDMGFLEAKCREFGAHEVEADVVRVAERCRVSGVDVIRRHFADLARALVCESRWLRVAPEAVAALVANRLRRSGWSVDEIDAQLQTPAEATSLRARDVVTPEGPAHVRCLVHSAKEIFACAVTPDSRRVVSASYDKTLKVWCLDTGRLLATLAGHTSWVTACAVMPDGRVVSGADDGTLKVWDLESKRVVLAMQERHASQVNACAAAMDGRCVVFSGSNDGTLKLWDLDSGQVLATLEGHTDWVRSCAATADGRRVVSGSYDGTLKVWDIDSRCELSTVHAHTDWVRAYAVTADGRRMVSASRDGTLKVWELETGRELVTLQGHTGWVVCCAVTADGQRAISGSTDGTVRIWDLESGRTLAILKGHTDWVRTCAVTPDGRLVISGSADGTLKVWDLEVALAASNSGRDRVMACAVTADGRRMISGLEDGTLKLWDVAGGRVLATWEGHAAAVNACAVTPDGRRAVSASDDGTLKVWDLENKRTLAVLEGHTRHVLACAITPDGRSVVSGSADETVRVWQLESGRARATLEGHAGAVRACVVTANGQHAISASRDRTLRIWDLERGRALATLEGHTGAVSACAVTADGRRAISVSADRTLKIWDLESERVLATLEGHAGPVCACAVTTDDKRVISASADRTLKVWDLETYDCLFTHRGDAGYTTVAATATTIITTDAGGTAWFLDWLPSSGHASSPRLSGSHKLQRHPPVDSQPRSVPPKKHTILFLAANPGGTDPRALDREAREIQVELERSRFRDCFELVTRWATEPIDLLRELCRLKPTVVHLSGHGVRDFASKQRPSPALHGTHDDEPLPGLLFQDAEGHARLVPVTAIAETFGAAGSSVKLVVLDACYSELQAGALLAHVDCVVGMRGSLDDEAARSFAIGFYGGLGARESVAAAYSHGCAAIHLTGMSHRARPLLKARAGVDADQLVLAAPLH